MLVRLSLSLFLAATALATKNTASAPVAQAPSTPATRTRPVFNVEHPGATPAHIVQPRPHPSTLMNSTAIHASLNKMAARRKSKAKSAGLVTRQAATAALCIDSSGTDVIINSQLSSVGTGAIVYLCPGSTISITNSIIFTAPNQVLATLGYPTDGTRATILVTGSLQSNAIYAPCDQCSGAQLRSLIINGNRAGLGILYGSSAIVEMGGNTNGQMIRDSHVFEPRGWSCLHGIGTYHLTPGAPLIDARRRIRKLVSRTLRTQQPGQSFASTRALLTTAKDRSLWTRSDHRLPISKARLDGILHSWPVGRRDLDGLRRKHNHR